MTTKRTTALLLLVTALLALAEAGIGQDQPKAVRTERFDKDPGWEGVNNRVVPKRAPTVTQDFGHSPTNFAGKAKGEMGGRIARNAKPAYYADKIAGKTLETALRASGSFALTASTASGGVFFGWFKAEQPGGGGRPIGSLGLHFDGERKGGRLAVRLIGATNKSCGTFVTPFIPGKFRPTPIKNDGTRYTWALSYDPRANEGKGRFQFTIRSNSPKPEKFEGQTFSVDLPAGFKKEGATFDRFGLMNMMKPGGSLTIYFDDLEYDGKREDFAREPGWVGSGNRARFEDRVRAGAHDFGFSKTNFAGGAVGEMGGNFWRSGKYGYYADRVGPLTMDDRLEASGKVVLKVGAPDSDMFIGWFSSAVKDKPPTAAGHFLGAHIGGPTRIGHYFHPSFTTAKGTKGQAKKGPVLVPGRAYEWSLLYDPVGRPGGRGTIRVTLGKESVTLTLRKGRKAEGARFDRFGVFTSDIGGQLVRIFFDDLKYTAGRPRP